MSNNLQLQIMLKVVDQATRPFKAVRNETQRLTSSIRETQASIKELDAQAAKIDGFRQTSRQLAATQQKLKNAKAEAAALAIQLRNSGKPGAAQAGALERARQETVQLQNKTISLRLALQQQREALNAAGIPTTKLGSEKRRLKAASAEANSGLSRQQQELQNLNQQQERLNQLKERFQKGHALSSRVRDVSASALSIATSGAAAATSLLRPGYNFAQAESTLQAATGLNKHSAELQALKTQARNIGTTTASSVNDAVQAQISIARSGGNTDDIKAAAPVALDMALGNNHTVEENVQLLMRTKDAFGLASNQVAHLGDVISATLTTGSTSFEDLNDALTSIAPVAQNAGVSVEQTTAMISALAKNGITGSQAGTGVRAMLQQLQVPNEDALKTINALGVKTVDDKGNLRPFFTILSEMQKAFDENNPGSAQQTESLKTIFGEEAITPAKTLMKAASNGQLNELTQASQQSDGSTAIQASVQQDNLGGDVKKLQAASETIGIDLFNRFDDSMRSLTQSSTQFLLNVDRWVRANPALAGGIANVAATGLSLAGAFGAIGQVAWPVITGINAMITGASMLGTAFTAVGGAITTALGALTWPILAVGAAIVAGALLIRKYWEPISAFISGVVEGFTAAMGPIGESFSTLEPVFSWFTGKVTELWEWFGKLLEPVKSTQAELAAAGDTGKNFGNMLAEALKIPSNALNQLMAGIDWVLDKLGIIDMKSNGLKDKVPAANPVAFGGAAVATDISYNVATGGAPYRPVTALSAGGNTQQNTYNSHYTINTHAGMSNNDVLALIAQQKAQEELKAQAQQRSKMS